MTAPTPTHGTPLTLDQQIEALTQTLRLIHVMAQRRTRQGKDTAGLVDHAMGLEAVLKNLQFQRKHEPRFKDLARQIVFAEQQLAEVENHPAVQAVMEAFPGAEIVDVTEMEEVE